MGGRGYRAYRPISKRAPGSQARAPSLLRHARFLGSNLSWGGTISEWEKWEGLLELGAELYPGGPDDRGLWERAGGDDADLSTRGDGRSRWRRAVRDMRNGRGPSASTLLGAMMDDFPKNERIPHLAGILYSVEASVMVCRMTETRWV